MLAGVFDVPQPGAVMDRLRQIVAAAELHQGDIVLDVGTGAGVLIRVLVFQCDVVSLPLKAHSVDVVFMKAMYGNVADKGAACSHVSNVLRPDGRLVVSHPEGRRFVEELRVRSDYE